MKKFIVLATIATFITCGCANTDNTSEEVREYSKTIYAMDTVMSIKAYAEDSEVLDKAEDEIKRIEALLTRGSENSEIYKINHSEETTVSEETAEILRTALEIGYDTDGAFDVSIASVMDLWGFYSQDFYVPADDELAAALKRVDYSRAELDGTTVKTPLDMSLDLGGIAKGYTSDRIMELLSDNGVESAVISLGGNVQTLGNKPDGSEWNVGIIDPFDENEYIGGVKNADKAVITSGGYQRNFEEDGVTYHHIIDPATGYPANSGLSSVTIISDNGIEADALSTALFVLGLEKASEYWRGTKTFEAVFVTDQDEIYITSGLRECFNSDRKYNIIE